MLGFRLHIYSGLGFGLRALGVQGLGFGFRV